MPFTPLKGIKKSSKCFTAALLIITLIPSDPLSYAYQTVTPEPSSPSLYKLAPVIPEAKIVFSENPDGTEEVASEPVVFEEALKAPEPIVILSETQSVLDSVYASEDSVSVSLKSNEWLNFMSVGFYDLLGDRANTPHNVMQFKNWLNGHRYRYHEYFYMYDRPSPDFSMNASTNVQLAPKFNVQIDQNWSRNYYEIPGGESSYDYGYGSVFLNYEVHRMLTASIGYDMSLERYEQEGYEQLTRGTAPMLNLKFKPFTDLDKGHVLEQLSFSLYAEQRDYRYEDGDYYTLDSRSQMAGVGINWNYKGFKIGPGISFRKEIYDLSRKDPVDVTRHYVSISKEQRLGSVSLRPYVRWGYDSYASFDHGQKFSEKVKAGMAFKLTEDLTIHPFVMLNRGKKPYDDHTRHPKRSEAAVELNYSMMGDPDKKLLFQVAQSEYYYPDSPKEKERVHMNVAVMLRF